MAISTRCRPKRRIWAGTASDRWTSARGHCGFSVAPCLPDKVQLLKDYLSPSAPWLPFRARSFAEYLDSFPAASVNAGMLVGHNTLRLMAMGMENRPPGDNELAHMSALLAKLQECGVKIRTGEDSVRVQADGDLRGADMVTEEHPGFPTDMQAQYMALATQAEGTSIVTENIFENRFMHAQELVRMGANIKIEGRRAIVRGAAGGAAGDRYFLMPSVQILI